MKKQHTVWKVEKTIRIGDCDIIIVIERGGLNYPNIDDTLRLLGSIHIPSDCKGIHKDLQFGDRVNILHDDLFACWGTSSPVKSGFRSITVPYCGFTKWKEGFAIVEEDLLKEVEKLKSAVNNRIRVLNEAEWL